VGSVFLGAATAAAILVAPTGETRADGTDATGGPTDWVDGAVFYHVFTLSFYDSNADGFGDLPGLIEKLDYLNDGDATTDDDLGVDAIRLMPVQPSVGFAGSDLLNHQAVNPILGTPEDFEWLCREAHARGMRVIMDLSLNHTSAWHPWFASSIDPASDTRDWYLWRSEDPGWTRPWEQLEPAWHEVSADPGLLSAGSAAVEGAYFYGVARRSMPDLNLRNLVVVDSLMAATRVWLERGLDGFCLTGARLLIETGPGAGQVDTPETHAFWQTFAREVRAVKPDVVLVGEARGARWTTTVSYFGEPDPVARGTELPVLLDLPLRDVLMRSVRLGRAGVLAAALAERTTDTPDGLVAAPVIADPSTPRVAREMRGILDREANVAAVLLTLPGAPFLFYGQEVGLRHSPDTSEGARLTPMPWSSASPGHGFSTAEEMWNAFAINASEVSVDIQTTDEASLLTRYRRLIRLRQGSEALRVGDLELLTPTAGAASVLAFLRRHPSETVLVAHNITDRPSSPGALDLDATVLEPLFVDPGVSTPTVDESGSWRIALPPRTSGVWRLTR
jgi:glycosidase